MPASTVIVHAINLPVPTAEELKDNPAAMRSPKGMDARRSKFPIFIVRDRDNNGVIGFLFRSGDEIDVIFPLCVFRHNPGIAHIHVDAEIFQFADEVDNAGVA